MPFWLCHFLILKTSPLQKSWGNYVYFHEKEETPNSVSFKPGWGGGGSCLDGAHPQNQECWLNSQHTVLHPRPQPTKLPDLEIPCCYWGKKGSGLIGHACAWASKRLLHRPGSESAPAHLLGTISLWLKGNLQNCDHNTNTPQDMHVHGQGLKANGHHKQHVQPYSKMTPATLSQAWSVGVSITGQ